MMEWCWRKKHYLALEKQMCFLISYLSIYILIGADNTSCTFCLQEIMSLNETNLFLQYL